jgi:hypothetical protein
MAGRNFRVKPVERTDRVPVTTTKSMSIAWSLEMPVMTFQIPSLECLGMIMALV